MSVFTIRTPIPRPGGWGFELLELKPPARGKNGKPLTSPVRVILRFEKGGYYSSRERW